MTAPGEKDFRLGPVEARSNSAEFGQKPTLPSGSRLGSRRLGENACALMPLERARNTRSNLQEIDRERFHTFS